MWSQGTISVKNTVVHYSVKHYSKPSEYGIEKGRISKLTLRCNGATSANYDRGWDIEPVNGEAKVALAILLKKYN